MADEETDRSVEEIDKRLADLRAPEERKPTALQQRRANAASAVDRQKSIRDADAMRRKAITEIAEGDKVPDDMAEHLRAHRYTVAEAKSACHQWRANQYWRSPRGGMQWGEQPTP